MDKLLVILVGIFLIVSTQANADAHPYFGVSIGSTDLEYEDWQDDATGPGFFIGREKLLQLWKFPIGAEGSILYTGEGDDTENGVRLRGDAIAFNLGLNIAYPVTIKETTLRFYVPVGISYWDGDLKVSCSGETITATASSHDRGQGNSQDPIGGGSDGGGSGTAGTNGSSGCGNQSYDGDDDGIYYGIGVQYDFGTGYFARASWTKYDIDFGGNDDPERIALDVGMKF
jgi:hypothetical protein